MSERVPHSPDVIRLIAAALYATYEGCAEPNHLRALCGVNQHWRRVVCAWLAPMVRPRLADVIIEAGVITMASSVRPLDRICERTTDAECMAIYFAMCGAIYYGKRYEEDMQAYEQMLMAPTRGADYEVVKRRHDWWNGRRRRCISMCYSYPARLVAGEAVLALENSEHDLRGATKECKLRVAQLRGDVDALSIRQNVFLEHQRRRAAAKKQRQEFK